MLIGTNNGQRMAHWHCSGSLAIFAVILRGLIASAISPPIAGRSNSKAVGGLSVPTALH